MSALQTPPMVPGAPGEGAYIDEAALARYLETALVGFRGPLRLTQFEGGQSNPTFLITAADENYVLRKKPHGALLASAHAIDREYRVLRALEGEGFPAPRVHHYCERDDVIGAAFYVMEHVEGRVLSDPALPGLSARERRAVYDSMNEVLARLHKVDWRSAGLGDFGRPDRYAERQIERWRRQSEAANATSDADMERLHGWLCANIPNHDVAALTHGDYRIGNLMVGASRPDVVAVLDWELSTIGHPFADLAFNCMAYYFPPAEGPASGIAGLDLDALGIPSQEQYLEDYARRSGYDPRPQWRFFMALSLYRTAAIQQGVYARALSGSASSRHAVRFGELYRMTTAVGCDIAFGNHVRH